MPKPKNEKIKVHTSEVYETTDGLRHATLNEAEARQKEIDETRYFRLSASPDCTEGRGLQQHAYAAVHGDRYYTDLIIQDAMFQRFGSPVDYVMGNAPTPAWRIDELDSDKPAPKPEEVVLEIRGCTWRWKVADKGQGNYWTKYDGPVEFDRGKPVTPEKST